MYNSFGEENIPTEIKKFIENKNITINIYRIQTYDSIMCGFCIELIDYMLKCQSLLGCTNLFFPNEYKKNEKNIKYYIFFKKH